MARQFSTAQTLANQTAAGVALGAVVTPHAEIEKTFQYVTITLPANRIYPQVINGNYFFVDKLLADGYEVTGSEYVFMRPDSQNATTALRYSKTAYRWERPFNVLQFENTSAIVYKISGWIGFGEIRLDKVFDVASTGDSLRLGSAQITRPANVIPYAAGQSVNIAGAGAAPLSFTNAYNNLCKNSSGVLNGTIRHAKIFKSSATTANASFRLYLFDYAFPASINFADQTTFALDYTTYSTSLIGIIDMPSFVAGGGAGAVCDVAGLDIAVTGGYDNINAVMVATAAYVPANAEAFRVYLWGNNN